MQCARCVSNIHSLCVRLLMELLVVIGCIILLIVWYAFYVQTLLLRVIVDYFVYVSVSAAYVYTNAPSSVVDSVALPICDCNYMHF